MAIEFARTHVIGRSSGHSAVRAAAYRAGERLFDARTGRTADYAHRSSEVAHREVLLPAGADPALSDRTALWSAVEAREDMHNRRASAQLALDHIVALPRELPLDQQIALARDYAQSEYVSKGVAVDLAVHLHSDGNPHAHLMTTTRYLDADGFGKKASELSGRFAAGRKVADEEGPRHRWAAFQNAWLAERGIELTVTNHAGEYPAERHLGPAHAIAQIGDETTLVPARAARVAERTAALLERPEIVIERVSAHRSLFTRRDLYRETGKLVDDPEAFATIKAKLDASELLIRLEHPERGELLTTRAVLETEQMIRARGELLARPVASFALDAATVDRAIGAGQGGPGGDGPALSDEQRTAVEHLTGGARLGIVEGLAGAGKSTMLRAVRVAHEAAGHRVTGLALAGKAADELEGSSGIGSRTIHSWLGALERGATTLESGEVVVVDEAGMVNNALMLRVMAQVEAAGAKLVLVGDAEQLQPIEAGCPLRDLAEQVGSVGIATIRRQTEEWQREATLALARGDARSAVGAYAAAGHVHAHATQAEAIDALAAAYLDAHEAAPDGIADRAVLAHRNADVAALNERVREGLKARGALTDVTVAERTATEEQPAARLELGVGDRVLFTKNDGRLGVRNGQLGTYRGRDEAGRLVVEQDGQGGAGGHAGRHADGRRIAVDYAAYGHLVHGYAMTVHKAQGRTVARAFVLGSGSMDRHLGYVALSRHRERVDVYTGADELGGRTLAEILGRARRQESALSFAERHGLGIEGVRVGPSPERPSPGRPSRARPSLDERLEAVERGDPAAEAWLLRASRRAHRWLVADAGARYGAAHGPVQDRAEAAERVSREASARVSEARRFFAPYPERRKPLLMRRRTWEAQLEVLARAEAADDAASRASRGARQAVDRINEAFRAERFLAEARAGNPTAVRVKEAGEALRARTRVRELIEERATLTASLAADGPDVDRHERRAQFQRLEGVLYSLAYGDASRARLTEAVRAGYRQEIETTRTARDRERGPDRGLGW